MLQFVLVGAGGTFPVPSGESRMGSDASCEICIRGEGILPTHAYLRCDEGKLLIRPADSGSSSGGYAIGAVRVNGTPLEGPTTIGGGEEIQVGTVRLKAVSQRRPRRSPWQSAWVRYSTWSLVGVAALAFCAFAVVRWWMLDEARLKSAIQQWVAKSLLRDETEIDNISVSFFEGKIEVRNVKLHERESFLKEKDSPEDKMKRLSDEAGRQKAAPFGRLAGATMTLDVWPLLRSGFKDFTNATITLERPELILDRSRADGTLNIADILSSYAGAPESFDLGVSNLRNVRLLIKNGRIRLDDPFMRSVAGAPIGWTALENIQAELLLPRQGEALQIVSFSAQQSSIVDSTKSGVLEMNGRLRLIDERCHVDVAKISDSLLVSEFTEFDLARIFEHFGYAWEPVGFNVKVMAGKPVSGKFEVRIENSAALSVDLDAQTQSLIAVKSPEQPAVGDLPSRLKVAMRLAESGEGYFRPEQVDLSLVSAKDLANPATTYLSFNAVGNLNPGGTSEYSISLDECVLQELLGTEVARKLGLNGRIGGRLLGKQKIVIESNNSWAIDARMEGKDTYVVLPPLEKDGKPLQQALPLNFETYATARPESDGNVNEISIQRFRVSGGGGGGSGKPSFEVSSKMLGMITGLGKQGPLETHAKFGLTLQGKEFWREFSPFLALFGMTRPVEEELNLEISLLGRNDFVEIGAKGTAARQWAVDPARVNLRSLLTYNRKAEQAAAGSVPPPYLTMQLIVVSDGGKPLNVSIDAQCKRTETEDIVVLERFEDDDTERKSSKPGLYVNSDMVALRERFKPYIEGFLETWDARANNSGLGLLHKYRDLSLTGELEYRGRIAFSRPLKAQSDQPERVDFDMVGGGKNLAAAIPLYHVVLHAPTQKNEVFKWSEPAALVSVNGRYARRISTNREEASTELLTLDSMNVQASVGTFMASVQEIDLFRLRNLRGIRNAVWSDCAGGLSISGKVDAPAFDLLRALQILPQQFPLHGTMDVQAQFDRKADSVDLKRLVFNQTQKTPDAFVTRLDLTAGVMHVRDLTAKLFPSEGELPFVERALAFVDELGPAGLLDFFGDNVLVNSLQVETGALKGWLARELGGPGRKSEGILGRMFAGQWSPMGTWECTGLQLKRDGNPKDRKWTLVGARLRNDLAVYGPVSASAKERPVAFAFTHDWAMKLGLSLLDNFIAANGDVFLDGSYIEAQIPALKYDYRKPAGEACKIQLSDCWYAHGRNMMVHLSGVKLSGNPLPIEIKDFEANYSKQAQGSYQVAELTVGGSVPWQLTVNKYEPESDKLQGRLIATSLDLGYLTSLATMPKNLKVQGVLGDTSLSYRGSLIALESIFSPAKDVLARHSKLEPTDPRLKGLNPETDLFALDSKAKGLRITASSATETANLALDGTLKFSTRDLICKGMTTQLGYTSPKGQFQQIFSSPNLSVASADPAMNLGAALRANGRPLNVSADVDFKTPLNFPVLLSAHDVFMAALGITPVSTGAAEAGATQERRLSALSQLVFNGNLKVPSVITGPLQMPALDAQNVALKNLRLTIPSLQTVHAGGKLEISDVDVDLTKSVILPDEKLTLKSVGHASRLKLVGAALPKLLGHNEAPTSVSLTGKLDAQGNLVGMDFTQADRLTWRGAVKYRVSELGLKLPGPGDLKFGAALPEWMRAIDGKPPTLVSALANAALGTAVQPAELLSAAKDPNPYDLANIYGVALHAYLARGFGLDVESLEFEPFEPTVEILNGAAGVGSVVLNGRGECEGLQLMVKNVKARLDDETFGEELLVYPLALPRTAQSKLGLARWPEAAQAQFRRDMEGGALAMRLSGKIANPVVKYPWDEIRLAGMRALFGVERFADMAGLQAGQTAFLGTWGKSDEAIALAASVADRMGVGLPGTVAAKLTGASFLDRVTGLPKALTDMLSVLEKPVSPQEALKSVIFALPDPPPVAPVPGKDPKAVLPKEPKATGAPAN